MILKNFYLRKKIGVNEKIQNFLFLFKESINKISKLSYG
jgi:hypothetical protein